MSDVSVNRPEVYPFASARDPRRQQVPPQPERAGTGEPGAETPPCASTGRCEAANSVAGDGHQLPHLSPDWYSRMYTDY